MTDHAKTIRDALMWAQAYAPDRLAHRLIDAEESLRELLAGHAAEVKQLRETLERRSDHTMRQKITLAKIESKTERELVEARAEAERQRIRYGSFLDWAIGFVVAAVEADDPEVEWLDISRDWMGRLEARLREERAALAAAQEPPADGGDRDA